MKIRKLTIDEMEINKAVEMYLATQGISLPVHSVSKEYSFSQEWEITFEFEVEVEKSDPPATVSGSLPALPEIKPLPPVMSADNLAVLTAGAEGGAK